MKACKGKRDTAPLILNLSTKWQAINFMPLPLYLAMGAETVHIEDEAGWAPQLGYMFSI
jgi:hypothetical protein